MGMTLYKKIAANFFTDTVFISEYFIWNTNCSKNAGTKMTRKFIINLVMASITNRIIQ